MTTSPFLPSATPDAVLTAYLHASRCLLVANKFEEGLPDALSTLGETLGVSGITIYEHFSNADGRLSAKHRYGWRADREDLIVEHPRFQKVIYANEGLSSWATLFEDGEPVYRLASSYLEEERPFLDSFGILSFMGIPIDIDGRIWGAISFDDCLQERVWTAVEIDLLQGLASVVGVALINARLYQSERRARERAEVLQEVARIISGNRDSVAIVRHSLEQLKRVLNFDSASLFLIAQGARPEFTGVLGFDNEEMFAYEATNLLKDSPILAKMSRDLQPVISHDVRQLDGWIWISGAEQVRSFMAMPLIIREEMIGALMLDKWQTNHFTPANLQLVETLARDISLAVENARLFETKDTQLRVSQTMQEVGALLTSRLNLEEVYERIFDLLARVVDYDSVSVQLIGEDGRRTHYVAGRGFADIETVRQFMEDVSEHSLKKVQNPPHWSFISDVQESGTWKPASGFVSYIRSWIGAALMIKGKIIGILNVDSNQPYTYNEEICETVAAFANQAAVAIENARLYSEIQKRVVELSILHKVAQATAAVVDMDELLQLTTDFIAGTLAYGVFGVTIVGENQEFLIPHSSAYGSRAGELRVPIDSSVLGKAVRSGKPVLVPDVRLEPLYFTGVKETLSEVAIPLLVKGKVIGVINAEQPYVNGFSKDDLQFLTTLGGQLSAAMERAKLYEALQKQADNLVRQIELRTAELQTERDRTLAILESAGESIVLIDVDANILYVNPSMERLSGYSREELTGKKPNLFDSGHTDRGVYKEMWSTVWKGERWTGEIRNRRKDGIVYDAMSTLTPLVDNAGKITGFVNVQADISHLMEVERLKSKFVSNVSHELRTPLTNIKTYVTLLDRGKPEKKTHYMKVLHDEIDRLARLIQDLLDLSRLEAEPPPVGVDITDMRDILTRYHATFSARAKRANIAYSMELPEDAMLAAIDPGHMGNLLTNLVGNALTYTPPDGTITLSAGEEMVEQLPWLWLRVADTGVGIEEEDLPHLFKRFYRGKDLSYSATPGTGLGLAICGEIARRYNGRIDVESQIGKGTAFTVWLPVTLEI